MAIDDAAPRPVIVCHQWRALVDSPCSAYVRTARMGFAEKGHGGDTQVVAPHPAGLLAARTRSAARLPDRREAVIRQHPSFIATAP